MCKNTLAFDYARRLDVIISTANNSANSNISLNNNNQDETIRSSNVVGVELYASDISSETVSGVPLITASDLQKILLNLRYEGSNDLALRIPALRLKIGQLDSIYRPYEFARNTRIDVGRSTIQIASSLTVAPCALSIIFYLNNLPKN
jgi:hypothetical protein